MKTNRYYPFPGHLTPIPALCILCFFVFGCISQSNKVFENEIGTADTFVSVQEKLSAENMPVTKSNDSIFLGYRLGMTVNEYDKWSENLLQKQKLQRRGKNLTYTFQVMENGTEIYLFGTDDERIKPEYGKYTGVIKPDFFNSKLISFSVIFSKGNLNSCLTFFESRLDKRYYSAERDMSKFKFIDSLSPGETLVSEYSKKWIVGDINAIVRLNILYSGRLNRKFVRDDVFEMKYFSEYYLAQKNSFEDNQIEKVASRYDDDF